MKVTTDVLEILGRARVVGNTIQLTEQLDRAAYDRTDKVLRAAGGEWRRASKAHVFSGDAGEAIEQILLTGEVTTTQELGAFFSPPAVAQRVIEKARLRPGMSVIEPNAGFGALASLALQAGCQVDCVDIDERNIKVLNASPYREVVWSDFLAIPPRPCYDRVLANPPFARQADIHHMNHALGFLAPGGLLVSVMSAGIAFRDNRLTQNFRDLIRNRGGEIEALPEGSFRESGTAVNTVIVTIPG